MGVKHCLRIIDVRSDEAVRTALAAVFFFLILFGYFLLRPAREALGVQSGMDTVRVLYLGTLVATAALNPLFALLVSRLPRRWFVPMTYRFFMVNIVAFAVLLQFFPAEVGEFTGRVYFVWLTVFALFNTMVFWAVMADTFSLEQSKRLYPTIAVGGTLGALAGSMLSWTIANAIDSGLAESGWSSSAALLVVSLLFFECAIWSYRQLGQISTTQGGERQCAAEGLEHVVIGGSAWQGLVDVVRSRYLTAICGYILLLTVISTVLYFTRLHIVANEAEGNAARTVLFANINIWTQAATLAIQLLFTGRLIRSLGIGGTLTILPIGAAAGLIAVAVSPTYLVITLVTAFFDAGRYAVARPSRETLFTVVNREQRYKAKAVIDTFVYRTGDVLGVGGDLAMRLFSSGIAAAAFLGIPFCLAWGAIGLYLGRCQQQLSLPVALPTSDWQRPNGGHDRHASRSTLPIPMPHPFLKEETP